MKLQFSRGFPEQLWIDGPLPLGKSAGQNRAVEVNLSGTSDMPFPNVFKSGDLLFSERPEPLQHAVTLLLEYQHSTVPSPSVCGADGWWSVPGAPVIGQIRIPLTREAIAKIARVDGRDHQYEVTLENTELAELKEVGEHKAR